MAFPKKVVVADSLPNSDPRPTEIPATETDRDKTPVEESRPSDTPDFDTSDMGDYCSVIVVLVVKIGVIAMPPPRVIGVTL